VVSKVYIQTSCKHPILKAYLGHKIIRCAIKNTIFKLYFYLFQITMRRKL